MMAMSVSAWSDGFLDFRVKTSEKEPLKKDVCMTIAFMKRRIPEKR